MNNLLKNIFNMHNPYKYFYNAIIHEDLFFTIYDYLRFNPSAARQYNIFSTSDLDNLTCEDWKDVAEDAIYWLEHTQFPKIYKLGEDANSPSMDTWELFTIRLCHTWVVRRFMERQLDRWK